MKVSLPKRRGLVFDIENMPGTYGPGDYTHPKVTAIGWQWLDSAYAYGITFDRRNLKRMAEQAEDFRKVWDNADFVLGHNIKRHDKKILDGFYTALGLPVLSTKRMVDTYLDMPKMAGLSRSLENLAERWDCPVKKVYMPEHVWEKAYDGLPAYVKRMKQRVISDVQINVWLFEELQRRGLL